MTGLQSVPVYKLPLLLTAPRKFSWENAFIDFSMADHDTEAAAAAEAKEAAVAAASAESSSGDLLILLHQECCFHVLSCHLPSYAQAKTANVAFYL